MLLNLKTVSSAAALLCLSTVFALPAVTEESVSASPGAVSKGSWAQLKRAPPPDEVASLEYGGPHGNPFDDREHVTGANSENRILWVEFTGCAPGSHLWGFGFGFVPRYAQLRKETVISAHGFASGDGHDFRYTLDTKEYITKIEVATYKAKAGTKYRTRIGWIAMTTSTKQRVQCGIKSGSDPYYVMEADGYGLLYMSGRSAKNVDRLQAHFMLINKLL